MNRKEPFETGNLYHVYNRGVEKRLIFKDKYDYQRFLISIDKFNTCEVVNNLTRDINRQKEGIQRMGRSKCIPLVRVHTYCLMPNHYHLILEQLVDGGISKFLQKFMTGYTQYFNVLHERSGVLFQGRTKSKLIDSDDYLRWLAHYIAMNPLDLCESSWKEKGIKDRKKALQFLKDYKWKSPSDYSDFNQHVVEYSSDTLRYPIAS